MWNLYEIYINYIYYNNKYFFNEVYMYTLLIIELYHIFKYIISNLKA